MGWAEEASSGTRSGRKVASSSSSSSHHHHHSSPSVDSSNNNNNNNSSSSNNDKLLILEELTNDIQQFAALKHTLSEHIKVIGTSRDSEKFRLRVKTTKTKLAAAEQRIQKHLAKRMDNIRVLTEAKRKHLQKLNIQFTSVREEYLKLLRECNSAEKKFTIKKQPSSTATATTTTTSKVYNNKYGDDDEEEEDDLMMMNNTDHIGSDDDDEDDDDEDGDGMRAMMSQQLKMKQRQKMQDKKKKEKEFTHILSAADAATIDVEKAIALETNRELQNLESDFLELHELFHDMNTMIQEQGESLNVIYDNVEKAHHNIEMGVENIKSSNQMTMNKSASSGIKKVFSLRRFLF